MRKVVAISAIVLMSLCIIFVLIIYLMFSEGFSADYDKRLSQYPLMNQSCLAVYRNAGGGAMTGYSHAFFIVPKCAEKSALTATEVEGIKPFLNTDAVAYSVDLIADTFNTPLIKNGDQNINISIDGDIYNMDEEQLDNFNGDIMIEEVKR